MQRRVKMANKDLIAQFLFFRRNSNSSFIRFRRWISPITDAIVVSSIEMPSFDYLKDVYIIIIINKGYTRGKTHTNYFEQTWKLLKCEEKISYLHDFCS